MVARSLRPSQTMRTGGIFGSAGAAAAAVLPLAAGSGLGASDFGAVSLGVDHGILAAVGNSSRAPSSGLSFKDRGATGESPASQTANEDRGDAARLYARERFAIGRFTTDWKNALDYVTS